MGMDRKIERKRWPAGRIAWVAVAAVAAAAVVYLLVVGGGESSLGIDARRLVISTVTEGPFQELVPVQGRVVPLETIFLDAVEGGRVDELFHEAGALVEEDEPILKLTNTNLHLDIMWREAELFQQSNNLRTARLLMEQYRLQIRQELADVENQLQQQERIYRRYRALAEDDAISQNELDLARDQYEYLVERRELTLESQRKDTEFRESQIRALEDSLARMETNLAVVKEKLDDLVIRAPVTGHLTALEAEVGQSKAPGERLGQIDVLEGFEVRARVDEHYVARVETGRPATAEIDGLTVGLAVSKVYPEVREGNFEVDLSFDGGAPEGIRRGQTLHLRLELGDPAEAVLLPRGGFYQDTGGIWAYVLDEAGETAVKRQIRIGRQNPEAFEVLGGLRPGERVITSSYEGFGEVDRLVLKRETDS
jgi:HlyD family secretion protein